MKRLLALIILFWALCATICVNAQQQWGAMFSSNTGYSYDLKQRVDKFLIAKIDNVQVASCDNSRVVTNFIKINWGNRNFVDCEGGFIKNKTGPNDLLTGNFLTDLGSNALFVEVDPIANTATALEIFKRVGANKDLGIQILGFEFLPNVYVIYNRTNLPVDINIIGNTMPAFGVGICDFNTGVFTPRPDLMLYANGNPTPIEDFQKLSNGKSLAVGAGDHAGSPAGLIANHGYLLETDGTTITNLNLPGTAIVAAKRILENGSFVWIGTDMSSTPVFKMDLTTNVLTTVPMGGLRINVYGITNVNNYTVFVGSTKGGANPTTQTILAHNNTTNVWEDWSGNIFPNTSTSNVVHKIIAFTCGRCENSLVLLTNNPEHYVASNCPYIPLPVSLIDFDARSIENKINLTWKTADEKNFSHFELEKSLDAKEFGSIETITNGKNFYSTLDSNPIEGINYYRLKMIDLDGKFTYSKTISIVFEKNATYVAVENPARNGEFNVMTNLENPNFVLLNSMGQRIETSVSVTDQNKFLLNTSNVPTGIYYLQIVSGDTKETKKVLVL